MEVLFPGSSETRQRFELQWVKLGERAETDLGSVRVTAYAVPHASGGPAYALRVACADKVVAYSGDGAWSEALVEASADADLFICEAYTFNGQSATTSTTPACASTATNSAAVSLC